MSENIFTREQEKALELTLMMVWTGRGKEVEDVSRQIHETMFPLTDDQIREIDATVETFIYGGGVQEQLPVDERLQSGMEYIKEKLLTFQLLVSA